MFFLSYMELTKQKWKLQDDKSTYAEFFYTSVVYQ